MTRASLAVLLLVAATLLAGCATPPGEAPAPGGPDGDGGTGLAFAPWRIVDNEWIGHEPSLAIDPDGRLFITAIAPISPSPLYVSEDNGTSWRRIEHNPARAPTTGDTSIAIGPDGAVYVTELWVGGNTVDVSHDHGATWTTSPISSTVPYYDRQWNAVDAQGRAYVVARQFFPAAATWASRSDDGGRTWVTVGAVWTAQGTTGIGPANSNLVVNPRTDALHLAYECFPDAQGTVGGLAGVTAGGNALCLSTSTDAGVTWTQRTAFVRPASVSNYFPNLAADAEGNLYATWAEESDGQLGVWIAWSPEGETWSEPRRLTAPPGTALFPWSVAGDAGRVAVGWIGTNVTGDNNDPEAMREAEWDVYVATTADARAPEAAWETVKATDRPIHRGSVSTGGFKPPGEEQADRTLGDFFTMALDPHGNLHLSFATGTAGEDPARTAYTSQSAGPRLRA